MIDPEAFAVLVVDDDPDLLEDMDDALRTAGYRVTACASGFAAVEAAQEQSFDLVVADIRMPGMDGLAALEKVRSVLPHMRSIVVTGFAAESDSIRAVRLGVGDYLRKPFRLEEFLGAVGRQLELCQAEKKRAGRELNLRRAALWAMENLTREVCAGQEPVAHSRLAFRVAQELGVVSEAAEEIQQALLARVLPERFSRSGLPPAVLRLVQELDATSEAPSLAARIALAVSEGSQSPAVSEAVARARRAPDDLKLESAQQEDQKRRGLLYLAKTMESGQPEAAHKAYQTLSGYAGTPEAVEAQLGFMRLKRADEQAALGHLKNAVQAAGQLNPMALAGTELEAGTFLLEIGRPQEAQPHFQNARRLAGEFGLRAVEASSSLGQLAAGGLDDGDGSALRSYEELLKPEHRSYLLDTVKWLLPATVQWEAVAPQSGRAEVLAYLARECPSEFERLPDESVAQQLVVIQALSQSAHPRALEFLRVRAADARAPVRAAADRALTQGSLRQPPLLRIYTLGRFEVYRGEEAIQEKNLRSRQARFLLAWLATAPGPVSVERIIDEFWPEEADAGRNNLNNLASALRKSLRPAGYDNVDYLIRAGATLEFNRGLPVWVDAVNFLSAAAQTDLAQRRQAVQLYRGPFLDSCYMDWAIALRDRLEVTARQCLGQLLDDLVSGQRFQEVVEQANRLLELDPCCQQTHAHLMQAFIQLKRPEAAVRQFEICQKALLRELSMEPSIALLELHQRARLSLA